MSSPEMTSRHGGAEVLGRSEGMEMAVRLPGKMDAMMGKGLDSTEGILGVKGARPHGFGRKLQACCARGRGLAREPAYTSLHPARLRDKRPPCRFCYKVSTRRS